MSGCKIAFRERHIKAAKLCGRSFDDIDNTPFSLESADDRERIMIALSEIYGIYVMYYQEDEEWPAGWQVQHYQWKECKGETTYKTYKEALIAAIKEA